MRLVQFFSVFFLFACLFGAPLQAQEAGWRYVRTVVEDKTGTQTLPANLVRTTSLEKPGDSHIIYRFETKTKQGKRTSYYRSTMKWDRPSSFPAGKELKLRYTAAIEWTDANSVYGRPDAYLGDNQFSVKINKPDPTGQPGKYLNYDFTLMGLRAPKGKKNGEEICITVFVCGSGSDPSGRSCVRHYYQWGASAVGVDPFNVNTQVTIKK